MPRGEQFFLETDPDCTDFYPNRAPMYALLTTWEHAPKRYRVHPVKIDDRGHVLTSLLRMMGLDAPPRQRGSGSAGSAATTSCWQGNWVRHDGKWSTGWSSVEPDIEETYEADWTKAGDWEGRYWEGRGWQSGGWNCDTDPSPVAEPSAALDPKDEDPSQGAKLSAAEWLASPVPDPLPMPEPLQIPVVAPGAPSENVLRIISELGRMFDEAKLDIFSDDEPRDRSRSPTPPQVHDSTSVDVFEDLPHARAETRVYDMAALMSVPIVKMPPMERQPFSGIRSPVKAPPSAKTKAPPLQMRLPLPPKEKSPTPVQPKGVSDSIATAASGASSVPACDEVEEVQRLRPGPPPFPPPAALLAKARPLASPPVLDLARQPCLQYPLAVAADGYTEWVARMCPLIQGKQAHNLAQLMRLSRMEPETDIVRLSAEPIQLGIAGAYLRLVWAEGRGWQRPTHWEANPAASDLVGAHGTTDGGALAILSERRVRRMKYAGVYGYMTDYTRSADSWPWICATIEKSAKSTKNYCGVVMELSARCVFEKCPGGIAAEEALCSTGVAAHAPKSNYGRWLLPEQYVGFAGMWVPLKGVLCDGLPGCRRDF